MLLNFFNSSIIVFSIGTRTKTFHSCMHNGHLNGAPVLFLIIFNAKEQLFVLKQQLQLSKQLSLFPIFVCKPHDLNIDFELLLVCLISYLLIIDAILLLVVVEACYKNCLYQKYSIKIKHKPTKQKIVKHKVTVCTTN